MIRSSSVFLPCVAIASLGFGLPSPVNAATFAVNSTTDAVDQNPGDGLCQTALGECTLRAAIMEANALAGADVVDVPAGTYLLTIPLANADPWYFDTDPGAGDLDITGDLTLRGAGSGTTIVDASGLGDRLLEVPFYVNGSVLPSIQVEIAGLTLRNGTAAVDGGCVRHWNDGPLTLRDTVLAGCSVANWSGGGLFHWGHDARVQLIDSVVRDNAASYGGGISGGNGTIELLRTTVTRNTGLGPYGDASGGGIYIPPGKLVATDSVISDNQAGRHGGGVYASQSDVILVRTTVSGNHVRNLTGGTGPELGSGGGLYLERVRLTLVNSTISGNRAEQDGAGVFGERQVAFDIAFSTIANNHNDSDSGAAGLQMFAPGPFVPWYQRVQASVFADNASAGGSVNCRFTKQDYQLVGNSYVLIESPLPPPSSGGFSVDEDGSCGLAAPSDVSLLDAGLGPLAANGGVGPTHALLPGSPAIDLVPASDCFFWVDDDLDYRVNEDPIDGIDNDGDWRVDEDPAAPVSTDQRGAARPYGAGCDTGAYEVSEVSAADQLAHLRLDVQALIDTGVINHGQGNALLEKLDAASQALAAGDSAAAMQYLQAFANQVEAFVRARILTTAQAEPLLAATAGLIAQLGG